MNWVAAASSVQWGIQPFIDGRYRTSAAIDLVDNVNPATEKALCQVCVGNSADVDAAVRVARQRFDDGSWCNLPSGKRIEILLRLVPEGVLNVVPCLGPTVGAALALHPEIDLLSFTGSTSTGRRLQELAGRLNGKPLLLECGGKSPQIVFNDVDDLDVVADTAVQSAMWNQAQVCIGRTRLFVHEDIKRPLLQKVLSRAARYLPGDPLNEATIFGPLGSPAQRVRVGGYIEQGLKEGADAVLKGTIQAAGGCYVSPTIFDRVENSMFIAREEIFGPVPCVQSFATDEEAVTLANETQYGLAATVWTRDIQRGRRMVRANRAGSIYIRSSGHEDLESPFLLGYEPQKASGFGSELGREGLESYSTLKAVAFLGS